MDNILTTYLEEDLGGVDLLKIRMDKTWVVSVLDGDTIPKPIELQGLLQEIDRLTDKDYIYLQLRYTWWLH
tara:strand:- start:664 stop:876 length:213 start_codon:yes stop_codon:yes gene_type:complete